MTSVAGLVVDWSTPEDLARLLITYGMVEEYEVDWYVWRNFHPDHRGSYDPAVSAMAMVLESEENVGHGAGINGAAREARYIKEYDYYLVINPDCQFRVPIVRELVEFLKLSDERWAVAPKQLDSKMRITAAGIFGTDKKPEHRAWHKADPGNKLYRDAKSAVMVAGSCFLTPAPKFHELGGLLEANHYFSDTWYSYHIRAHGGSVWHYGTPWIIHEWHQSSRVGAPETDGRFKEDQDFFRLMCDSHVPPIECE